MKCVYKIGRLYIISSQLFDCFDPFLIPNLQYDDISGLFYDSLGTSLQKPATFHENQNVLFFNYSIGEPDLTQATKISVEQDITVWRTGSDWIYSCNYGQGWLQITSDYHHATYYHGQPDANGCTTTIMQPILMAVECSILMQGYLIVHAACIEIDGKAVLFSAPSGIGKSTRANIWIESLGASFISGDRPIIDPIRNKALGAPWDGKEGIHRNIEVSISAFNCIQRSEKTKLTRMTIDEKKHFLATQTFIPMWDPFLVSKVFIGIGQMIHYTNIWNLSCDRTIQAAKECYELFFPREPQNILELLDHLKAIDTPKSEYKTDINRFMEFKARKLGIPYNGTFELTPLCNLDCKMCYVHLQKQQMSDCFLLDTDHWKILMREAHDAGMKTARLTGGECLTYPGFDELYLYLQKFGIDISVLTNGLLLNDDRIAFFKKHPAQLIQVTIYGSDDDAYEKVTGVRCFKQVFTNILHAKEAGLPITIAITPNAFAYQDLPNIIKLVEKTGIPYNINSILNKPRNNTGRDLHDLTNEQYVELYQMRAQIKSEHLQPIEPTEIQDPPTVNNADIGIKCGAGRSMFTITWEGKVKPCLTLSDLYQSTSNGNFREEWKKINKWANELPVPAECSKCSYQPHCIQCIGIHYNPDQPGHCNKDVCQRTKKFIEAGLYRL